MHRMKILAVMSYCRYLTYMVDDQHALLLTMEGIVLDKPALDYIKELNKKYEIKEFRIKVTIDNIDEMPRELYDYLLSYVRKVAVYNDDYLTALINDYNSLGKSVSDYCPVRDYRFFTSDAYTVFVDDGRITVKLIRDAHYNFYEYIDSYVFSSSGPPGDYSVVKEMIRSWETGDYLYKNGIYHWVESSNESTPNYCEQTLKAEAATTYKDTTIVDSLQNINALALYLTAVNEKINIDLFYAGIPKCYLSYDVVENAFCVESICNPNYKRYLRDVFHTTCRETVLVMAKAITWYKYQTHACKELQDVLTLQYLDSLVGNTDSNKYWIHSKSILLPDGNTLDIVKVDSSHPSYAVRLNSYPEKCAAIFARLANYQLTEVNSTITAIIKSVYESQMTDVDATVSQDCVNQKASEVLQKWLKANKNNTDKLISLLASDGSIDLTRFKQLLQDDLNK